MKEYLIQSSKNKGTGFLDIQLQGHLNISYISSIQKEIFGVLKNNKKINIEISKVDEADLSLIQLIVALRDHFSESKMDFKISYDLNPETVELLNRAGFANIIN